MLLVIPRGCPHCGWLCPLPCPTIPVPCPVTVCWAACWGHMGHIGYMGYMGHMGQWEAVQRLHADPGITLPLWLSMMRRLNEAVRRCVGYPRAQDLAQIIHLLMNTLQHSPQ